MGLSAMKRNGVVMMSSGCREPFGMQRRLALGFVNARLHIDLWQATPAQPGDGRLVKWNAHPWHCVEVSCDGSGN